MKAITLVDYDPVWPRIFEEIREAVWSVLSDFAVAVEHVGSTSVPGLAAKPVVDIDVIVSSDSDVHKAIGQLETLGYEHRGDLGVIGREAFRHPPSMSYHHLYACRNGVTPLRNHLVLRDYLRLHPKKVVEYGNLKKQLAEKFPNDIDSYIAGKTDFILKILKESGFSGEELQLVANANR